MAKLCSRLSIFWLSLYYYFLSCLAMNRKNITTDESALLAFKSSITLDPYHMLNNWSTSSSSSLCNWVGVTCDLRHERVKALNLSNMDLVGTISPHVGNLSFLVKLDLRDNSFHGQLPQELFQLHRLRLLNLSHNKIGGFISQSISSLSKLEYLDCRSNFIKGAIPPTIGLLRQLKLLNLRNNTLSGTIPPTISNLSSLEEMILSHNSLSGEIPREMGDLAQLRVMNLHHNQLSGDISSAILNNSMFQSLFLSYNNLSGSLPSNICQGLPKLRALDLQYNDLSGKMPTVWHQCKELEELILSNNNFDKGQMPSDFGNLTMLRYLYLVGNNLEGEFPFSLLNISSLREFSLDENNLSGSLPHGMCHQLFQLEVLGLDSNQLEGSIPRSIGNCTLLKKLGLRNNFLTGPMAMEIGNLDKLEFLSMGFNNLSGPIPSKLLNISTLALLHLGQNSLSGILPSDMGYGLPNLEKLILFGNRLVGNIPNGLSNASMLTDIELGGNEFSGIVPNIFGDLTFLNFLSLYDNKLTTNDSHEPKFLTSLTNCIHLQFVDVSGISLVASLPKSIGNLSKSLDSFLAESCGIDGNIPPEVGNMSSLIFLSLYDNDISGPMPASIKGLQDLQILELGSNRLQGSIIDELCGIGGLSELHLYDNKLSGVIPTCLGNMTSLRVVDTYLNKLTSGIPLSFWNLQDLLRVDLSSNALAGKLPPEIGKLRALVLLDLSGNEISGNIPSTISFLKTVQNLSLASNKLQGPIPTSLGEMVSLCSLDLSQNLLSGVIPKSLESLAYLEYINLSYNRLQGEIPNSGRFVNFTAQSFMHNEALCGNPRLLVPPCAKQVRKRSRANMLLIKCLLPIVVSIVLAVACTIVFWHKRKNVGNPLEWNSTTLGAPKRISYYELVRATNGFNENTLLGRGSFGSVYQGMLSNGLMVAIKMFDLDLEATSKSFEVECNAMRTLRHRNLVKIISSCSNDDFKYLVMEFMSNGSLDKWLYLGNYYLDFLQRLSIMTDVAFALEYLHHGSSTPVIHCDLKPSNVLLDEDMVAHVSDFGIAKLLDKGQSKTHTETFATLGYIAPEYGSKGTVSIKGDVYSYGIMLIEVFTRKKPTDDMFAEGLSLKNWISQSMPNSIMEVLDSNLVQRYGDQIDDILPHISSILELALSCCADPSEERIKMTDVVALLTKIKSSFT